MVQKVNTFWFDPEFLVGMISKMPGYVYWKNVNGVILGCNEGCAELVGCETIDQVVGKTDHELGLEPGFLEQVLREDQEVLQQGKTVIAENSGIFNGKFRHFTTEKRPLYHDGSIVGLLGITLDITAEKTATDNLMRALKVTAANISHEMKTPLAGMKTTLEVMQKLVDKLNVGYEKAKQENLIDKIEGKPIYDKLGYYMSQIFQRINSATTMISMQLKNMSIDKIDARLFSKLSIETLIAEAMRVYPFSGDEKSLVHYDTSKDFTLLGEKTLTINIMWNLLNNAMHAIRDVGKGTIKIWIEGDAQWNYLHFKDTAKGMTPSVVEQAFDKFFTERRDGCGLGLAFCQKVMRAYGGDITCSSNEGEYTHFILKFPQY